MIDRTSAPAAAGDLRRDGWPKIAWARRLTARARTWLCARLCDGYDRRAGRVVDGLLSEIDRLRSEGQS